MSITPVLISGGGPSGLAAATELAFHGIASVVVEPRHAVSADRPRAKTTSIRTMEHFRRWGFADKIRAAASLPVEFSDVVVFCSAVDGYEITRFTNCLGLGPETAEITPELGQQIAQPVVERVMREHLALSPLVTFKYGSRVTGVSESADSVTSFIENEDGSTEEFVSRYVLAADGAASAVRKSLGIKLSGTSDVRPNFNFIFRAPDLEPPMGDAVHYWVVGGNTPGVMGRLDLDGTWWAIAPSLDESTGKHRTAEIVTDLVGHEVEHEVLSTDSWTARLLVADQFQTDRVFFVGESAHLNPPWGGHGFNTCVGDAVNIGWKIAAVENGWAGPELLQTYEAERKPIAEATILTAGANMRALPVDLTNNHLAEEGPVGDAARLEAAEAIQLVKDGEFHALGVVLGYSYAGSPIVGDAVIPVPTADASAYEPSTDPGSRLAHTLLADGTPLFDALGPEFTLLIPVGTDRADVDVVVAQAAGLGVPLTVIDNPFDGEQGADFLLVRPDQHVAERSASLSDISLSLAIGAEPVAA
ncbi:FAD-dependent monooxygenase [Subtercola lobariae]|uniref:Monooxygenase n=1 Tax=Subtercola lobariae TaxID=1588641 RepID=A0A917B842_9MICO|nr:FAD-dependent monooxygenase [Subtercola lobariae]GGF30932.1 monooxygenase [Subtercola lobariae]